MTKSSENVDAERDETIIQLCMSVQYHWWQSVLRKVLRKRKDGNENGRREQHRSNVPVADHPGLKEYAETFNWIDKCDSVVKLSLDDDIDPLITR